MKNIKSLAQICLVVFAALTLAASTTNAQTDSSSSTNSPASSPTVTKKPRAKRFTGKVTAVDTSAMTITWENAKGVSQTVQITSKTRIRKDGQPATLEDITAGLRISGGEHQDESSNWVATTVMVGQRKPTPPAAAPASPAAPAPAAGQ